VNFVKVKVITWEAGRIYPDPPQGCAGETTSKKTGHIERYINMDHVLEILIQDDHFVIGLKDGGHFDVVDNPVEEKTPEYCGPTDDGVLECPKCNKTSYGWDHCLYCEETK